MANADTAIAAVDELAREGAATVSDYVDAARELSTAAAELAALRSAAGRYHDARSTYLQARSATLDARAQEPE